MGSIMFLDLSNSHEIDEYMEKSITLSVHYIGH